ncbi:MAG: 2-oxo acid dehydrogenase subunit E2 [Myxococcota bacterium]|nr:2-oxo acid dehydrogenase subunit E2 [Myxococcota bacterium]
MKIEPLSNNRFFLYEHLTRAKRFHCSVSGVYQYDVTDLLVELNRQKAEGRAISFVSLLVKATALVLERHPRMNRHLFHGLFRKFEVDFGTISCTLIVHRFGPDGEDILFPVIIDRPHERTMDDIYDEIRHFKKAPLNEIPQIGAFERIKKMPRFMIRWFSYKARSDPRFYMKYFGTYGLSSMLIEGWGPQAGHGVASVGSGFQPGVMKDTPVVVDGEIVIRKMLTLGILVDHYLLDGADAARAMMEMRGLLETNVLLESGDGP